MLLFIWMIQDIKRSRKDLAELSGDVRMPYIPFPVYNMVQATP